MAFPKRRATHEFIITLKRQDKELHVTAMDLAKRLLDYGYHAPTTYFPLLVPECLLIEPTETESKEDTGRLHRRHGQDRAEAENRPRGGAWRAPHPPGTPPGRGARRARTEPDVDTVGRRDELNEPR